MINVAMKALRNQVVHRVWIFSDLQQRDPVMSEKCLTVAVEDFRSLQLDCEQIWYLGDAVEGANRQHVEKMAKIQVELLQPLGIPLTYVLGNHDFDLYRDNRNQQSENIEDQFPFYQEVKAVPGWKTVPNLQSNYFISSLGNYKVVFFSDHCGAKGDWYTTGGIVRDNASLYPYAPSDYSELSKQIGESQQPVITAGHYAFAGGNRPSDLMGQMLPLPANVKIHFHGHAHIGDHYWAGKDCYKKIGFVESQPIPQINASSLENTRGDSIRSVIFEIYTDGSMGVYFRNHERGEWTEHFIISGT